MQLPLTGTPSEVLSILEKVLGAWVNRDDVRKINIERSVDPDGRANAHYSLIQKEQNV